MCGFSIPTPGLARTVTTGPVASGSVRQRACRAQDGIHPLSYRKRPDVNPWAFLLTHGIDALR